MKKLSFILLGVMLSLSLQAAPGNGNGRGNDNQLVNSGNDKSVKDKSAKDEAKQDNKADKKAEKDARLKSREERKAARQEEKAARRAERKARRHAVADSREEPQDPTDALIAHERHVEALLQEDNVIGSGVSWDRQGNPVIKVFLSGRNDSLPKRLDGIRVVRERTSPFYSMNIDCADRRGNAGCEGQFAAEAQLGSGATEAVSQKDWQMRPVPIGVSIGTSDLTAGTLGCRVSAGCHNYALTNAHVAGTGSQMIQPSAVDGGIAPDDTVALLFQATPIVMDVNASNVVDAALYQVDVAEVGTATRSNGYGEPKATTLDPSLGLDVMKYGRSSAMTNGYIDTINATLIVQYPEGQARFVNQMMIRSDRPDVDFTMPGDSGSLVVARGGDEDRQPVGLVFASSRDYTVANPINEVLAALDVDIDGEF